MNDNYNDNYSGMSNMTTITTATIATALGGGMRLMISFLHIVEEEQQPQQGHKLEQ